MLNKRTKDGSTERDYLEAAAAQGNENAQKELQGPPLPEAVAYLYDWARELIGRSGFMESGFCPLSYTTLRDWATLTDRNVGPHEVNALMTLDAVMRNPEALKEKA